MGDAKWFESWVPWPELAGLAAAGRAMLPTVPPTPAGVLRFASEQLLGRRITATVDGAEVAMTLTRLDHEIDSFRLASGRLGNVRVVMEDVSWPETPLKSLVVVAHDVRFRSLPTPNIKPASVEIEITVSAEVLAKFVAEARPGVLIEPGPSGLLEVRWARHPRWGRLELEPLVEGAKIRLLPRSLFIAGRRFKPPRRITPIELELPELPPGLRLTAIEPRGDELVGHALAEQWPDKLSRIPLADLLTWLTTTALTLTVPRLRS